MLYLTSDVYSNKYTNIFVINLVISINAFYNIRVPNAIRIFQSKQALLQAFVYLLQIYTHVT